ncbi:CesT family type III secretion system chaperone [Chthonobacter rhizosphaerae]|uniref:CesT family type III secretion system chaperone n=1 Tax=Chthonobacter rhizosphaerae TaxID=2735553 RepID=UPI0015EF4F82|nr:CesT family type III secretion system chaperone [Chthonobacter rhizosphaerae]
MTTRVEALMADLWRQLGLTGPDPEGGAWRLTLGEDLMVQFIDEGDGLLYCAAEIGPLPQNPSYALALTLLRSNNIDSPDVPFAIGADKDGDLFLWAHLPVEATSGEELADMLDRIGDRVPVLRQMLTGEEEEVDIDDGDAPEPPGGDERFSMIRI